MKIPHMWHCAISVMKGSCEDKALDHQKGKSKSIIQNKNVWSLYFKMVRYLCETAPTKPQNNTKYNYTADKLFSNNTDYYLQIVKVASVAIDILF